MGAIVPNKVETIDARVDSGYGTPVKTLRIVYVDATTTANTDTVNLTTYVPGGCSGICGVLMNTNDGAVNATAPTWSGTTVTFAGHAGSGGAKLAFLVY